MNEPVAIIGGGLAGLTAAYRLHQQGIPFVLLEARNRLGGRILSVDKVGRPSSDGFDLGPSWLWPGMQPAIGHLVAELNLPIFPQQSRGAVVLQRMSKEPPQRYEGLLQQPQSMRIEGGTARLVAALAAELPAKSVRLEAQVETIAWTTDHLGITFKISDGEPETISASQIVLALPPRLAAQTIRFEPPLSDDVRERWHATPTWMAPNAKFFALYDRPFWREAGLSGAAQSMVGPLVEIHDATTASGKAALFGFVGIGAEHRTRLAEDTITSACLDQLELLFGPEARRPVATLYKDWAADPLTATLADQVSGEHPEAQHLSWIGGEWNGRLVMGGSESSSRDPGYLAGAAHAGAEAARQIIYALHSSTGA